MPLTVTEPDALGDDVEDNDADEQPECELVTDVVDDRVVVPLSVTETLADMEEEPDTEGEEDEDSVSDEVPDIDGDVEEDSVTDCDDVSLTDDVPTGGGGGGASGGGAGESAEEAAARRCVCIVRAWRACARACALR